MDKYGIENVRGGSFCEIILDDTTIKLLEKMRKTVENKCFICGKTCHFAKECKKNEELDSINKCFRFIENFIEEKKKLEIVDPKFEMPKTIQEIRMRGGWGTEKMELLRKEKERAKNQKEKNEEYLPLFEVFYKVLQHINEK